MLHDIIHIFEHVLMPLFEIVFRTALFILSCALAPVSLVRAQCIHIIRRILNVHVKIHVIYMNKKCKIHTE